MALDRRALMFGVLGAIAGSAAFGAENSVSPARALDGPRLGAAKPPVRWLAVLCHGYGSDGNDIIALATTLRSYLPTAAFVAPNGPLPANPGYSWFPVFLTSPNRLQEMRRNVLDAGPILNSFIDAELAMHKLPPNRLILIGFSQGAVTVLNIGLRRKILPAAIVAFAGANLATEAMPLIGRALPVLLIDGSEDHPEAVGPVVATLKNSGVNVQSRILPGLGHAIDGRGVALAGAFMREVGRGRPKL